MTRTKRAGRRTLASFPTDRRCQWSNPNVAVMTCTQKVVTSLPPADGAERLVGMARIEEGR